MQAVILAAGCGSRLKEYNKGNPKALIKLDKARLVEYQISILRYFGIDNICIVIGYEGDNIQSVVGDQCYYAKNKGLCHSCGMSRTGAIWKQKFSFRQNPSEY